MKRTRTRAGSVAAASDLAQGESCLAKQILTSVLPFMSERFRAELPTFGKMLKACFFHSGTPCHSANIDMQLFFEQLRMAARTTDCTTTESAPIVQHLNAIMECALTTQPKFSRVGAFFFLLIVNASIWVSSTSVLLSLRHRFILRFLIRAAFPAIASGGIPGCHTRPLAYKCVLAAQKRLEKADEDTTAEKILQDMGDSAVIALTYAWECVTHSMRDVRWPSETDDMLSEMLLHTSRHISKCVYLPTRVFGLEFEVNRATDRPTSSKLHCAVVDSMAWFHIMLRRDFGMEFTEDLVGFWRGVFCHTQTGGKFARPGDILRRCVQTLDHMFAPSETIGRLRILTMLLHSPFMKATDDAADAKLGHLCAFPSLLSHARRLKHALRENGTALVDEMIGTIVKFTQSSQIAHDGTIFPMASIPTDGQKWQLFLCMNQIFEACAFTQRRIVGFFKIFAEYDTGTWIEPPDAQKAKIAHALSDLGLMPERLSLLMTHKRDWMSVMPYAGVSMRLFDVAPHLLPPMKDLGRGFLLVHVSDNISKQQLVPFAATLLSKLFGTGWALSHRAHVADFASGLGLSAEDFNQVWEAAQIS